MGDIIKDIKDAYQKKVDADNIKRTRRHDRIVALEDAILERKDTLDRLLEIGKAIDTTNFSTWDNDNHSLWADDKACNFGFHSPNNGNFCLAVWMADRIGYSREMVIYNGELHVGSEVKRYNLHDTEYEMCDWDIDKIINFARDYNNAIKALTTFRDSITAFDNMITPLLSQYIDYCNNYYKDVTKGVI